MWLIRESRRPGATIPAGASTVSPHSRGSALWQTIATSGTPKPAASPRPGRHRPACRPGDRIRRDPRRRSPPTPPPPTWRHSPARPPLDRVRRAQRRAVTRRRTASRPPRRRQLTPPAFMSKAAITDGDQGRDEEAVDHRRPQHLEPAGRQGQAARRARGRQEGPGHRPRDVGPHRDRAQGRVPLGHRRLPVRREAARLGAAFDGPCTNGSVESGLTDNAVSSTARSATPSPRSRRTAAGATTATTPAAAPRHHDQRVELGTAIAEFVRANASELDLFDVI